MTGPELIAFIDSNIKANEKGKPFTLSDHQRVVIGLMWGQHYSIRLWSEIKKSGKTFLAACVCLAEAYSNQSIEIICLANDLEQSTGRVFQTCVDLIKYNIALTRSARVLAFEIRLTNGSAIKAVSSDYKGQAGGRQKLAVFDELCFYSQERAVRLFEEMTPPVTEPGAYILIVSTAGFTGEGQLLENLYLRGLKGKRLSRKFEVYRDKGLCMFWSHKPRLPEQLGPAGRAYYQEQKRFLRPNTYLRLHENRWVSSESTFIDAEAWDAIVDQSLTPILSGAAVHLGIDIGIKNDSTGVVGVARQGDKVRVAFHKCWKPFLGEPVNLDDVEAYILDVKNKHQILGAYADPSQCLGMIQRLATKGVVVKEFPQTLQNTVQMGTTLFTLISDRNLVAYPSAELKDHVINAVGQESERGVRMVKKAVRKKIDLAVGLAMACVSAVQGPGPINMDLFYAGGDRLVRKSDSWVDMGGYNRPGLHPMDVVMDRARSSRGKFWDS
jgi:phage terminase large subunit-like protein